MREMIEVNGYGVKVEGRLLKIARLDAEKYLFVDDPEAIIESLRKARSQVDIFTFIQKPSETQPKHRYAMESDNMAVLPVSTFDYWWNVQVDAKTRNMVRKAERKGVQTREEHFDEELVRGIWEIYNEVPIRQGREFRHFGKDYETVYKEEATHLERSIFVGALLDAKLIGFIKLLLSADGCHAGLLNIVSLVEHRDKAPNNALISHAVKLCADRNISYLTYSGFSYGKRKRDSMSDFKKNNGFHRVDVPRYYVPLTFLGWAAFRLGFHKRLLDRVPEPMIVKFRELRSAWHDRSVRILDQPS